jgi:hypothetical protein
MALSSRGLMLPRTARRLLMEYDNVALNFATVALVHGTSRIQGVPVTSADPSQPAGAIPTRRSAGAPKAP